MRALVFRSAVVAGVFLLAPAAARAYAPSADVCARDGTILYAEIPDRSGQMASPKSPTQAGIDALGSASVAAVNLRDLMTDQRVCPVADFSALSRVQPLDTIIELPTECLQAFARTAHLPALRQIQVMCGDDKTIDLRDLAAFPTLETVRLDYGCRHGPTGLAPLAALPRLRTLLDPDSGRVDGVDALTKLTNLAIGTNDGAIAPIAKLPGLRGLALDLHAATDLTQLGQHAALEELIVHSSVAAPLDVAPLGNLTSLRRLAIHTDVVAHAAALANLHALCMLDLGDVNRGTEVVALASLNRLQSLALGVTGASSLAPLSRLQALKEVELRSGCEQTLVDLAPLAGLPRLSHLFLDGAMKVKNGKRLASKTQRQLPRHCGGHHGGAWIRRSPPT
jgi:hypothetical protein